MGRLWLAQTMLTIVEIVLAFWGVGNVLKKRAEGVRRWILRIGVVALISLTVYQRTLVMYSRWWLVITVVFCGFLDFICYKRDKRTIWAIQMVYFETLYCLDLFFFIAFKILRGEQHFLIDLYSISLERILLYLISRGIVAVGILMLYKNRGKVVQCLKSGSVIWIIVAAFEHFSLIICDSVFVPGMEAKTIGRWKILLLLYPFLIIILACFCILQRYRLIHEQEGRQNALYADRIRVMEKEKQEKEGIYHDFKNHMIALKGLISDGDIPGAQEYLEGLLKAGEEIKQIRVGLQVLDYLIQMKVSEAILQGIKVQEQYEGRLPKLNTNSIKDWCALLGNLWDNALEGCACLECGRWIRFSMRREGAAVAIKMENSCLPEVDAKNPVSRKADRNMHGMGIRNIDHVVNKYGGMVERECRDGIFSTQIIIILREWEEGEWNTGKGVSKL